MKNTQFFEHPKHCLLLLGREKKLNVLNEDLVGEMGAYLDKVGERDLVLSARGEKSFCAGGDVVDVVNKIQEGREWDFFFKKEYELDLRLHQTSFSCFAHGIIMGGGMGLLQAASNKRFACEGSILSMPEVTIGFFPDVGASFFLQRAPSYWAKFLALTGARLPVQWAKLIGLIDHVVKKESYWSSLEKLEQGEALGEMSLDFLKLEDREEFQKVDECLQRIKSFKSLEEFDDWSQESDVAWVESSLKIYREGSPASKVITWHMLEWAQGKKLEECFKQDLHYARLCSLEGDFKEGVRALLIDKDKSPQWRDKTVVGARERLNL